MEFATCASCGETSVSCDEDAGVTVCHSCGWVSDDVVFRHVDFNEDGARAGTYVGGRGTGFSTGGLHRANWSTSHSLGIDYRALARKNQNYERIDEVSSLLSFPKDKASEVKHMIGVITEDRYGSGHWIDVLIGTCIYVVARQNQLPLPVREIASYLQCAVEEIMRTYRQVCHLLDLETSPAINQCAQFDRVTSRLPGFSSMEKDLLRRICKQGHCLLECASDWFLSTGRHPSAIVAASILAVGKANNIKVDLDYVSRELHVYPNTSRMRYGEIMNALVGMAEKLPWGKDINRSTVEKHLPFLLQYLQVSKRMNPDKGVRKSGLEMKATSKECIAAKHLVKAIKLKYGQKVKQLVEQQPFIVADEDELIKQSDETIVSKSNESTHDDVFDESTAIVPYAQIVDVPGQDPASSEGPPNGGSKKRKILSVDENIRQFELIQLPKRKNVWKPLPPSYLANESAKLKRMLKIEAARKRILSIKKEIEIQLRKANGQEVALEKTPQDLVQSDKPNPHSDIENDEPAKGLDAEDLLIQYCLICGGDEELIKDGYFHIVLSTPPVQNHKGLSDEDLHQYFKSREEIEFLESLDKGEELPPWLEYDELF